MDCHLHLPPEQMGIKVSRAVALSENGLCDRFADAKPGEAITTANGVKVLGYSNWPGRIAGASSALYARNLLTFLTTFWDKEGKKPKLVEEDEIVKGVALTRGGAVVHPSLAAG